MSLIKSLISTSDQFYYNIFSNNAHANEAIQHKS